METKKTSFQNWVDTNYSNQSGLLKKLNTDVEIVKQQELSRDYNHKNALEKIGKYAKKLGLESVDFHGHDYGCEVKGTLKIK